MGGGAGRAVPSPCHSGRAAGALPTPGPGATRGKSPGLLVAAGLCQGSSPWFGGWCFAPQLFPSVALVLVEHTKRKTTSCVPVPPCLCVHTG